MKQITDDNFELEVLKTDGIKAVKFGAIWCGPCRMLKQSLKAFDNDKNIPIYEVDVDECPKTSDIFGIKSVPQLIIIQDGKEIERFSGSNLNLQEIFTKYTK